MARLGRAISNDLGLNSARLRDFEQMEPWDLAAEYYSVIRRPLVAKRTYDRAQERLEDKVARPLCGCGCGEHVGSSHNGVWSQFIAGHQNRLEGVRPERTIAGSCKNGHVRTPENTHVGLDGSLKCRTCSNERRRKKVA